MEIQAFRRALGKLIAKQRERVGWSQERLALEAGIDRTRVGEIERGEANPTIETLHKIATALKQTLASLMLEAEEAGDGRVPPQVIPEYFNRAVRLPQGLTHEQLETALNRSLAILDQIGINPEAGDIQGNIYSGAVSNIVTASIAEVSDFIANKNTRHPDLLNPQLPADHPDYGLELKATNNPMKGAESHNPGHGWFMIVVYKVIDGQTHIIRVMVAELVKDDWKIDERNPESNRTRTERTRAHATQKLRAGSVYLHPDYVRVLTSRT
jgi:transcriptional regulator with XRE-family HTH domain